MTATPSPLLTDPAALTRLALSAAPVFVYACDRELRYTWIDKANADALPGWPIGRRDDEIMAPDSAARLMAFKREVIETGQVLRREIAIECGDRAGHYAVTAQPVRDAEGSVVGLVATAVDVTERVRAEEELRESEERLRLALETARLGAWVRDLRTGELTCTAQCKANFGRGPAERLSYEDIAEATLEEDRLRTAPAAREAVMSRGEYNVEYRIRWPDGSLHWIASRGRAFYAPDGTPLRMIGVSLDVTERKRFEAEQRQQAEELERRVAERTRQLLAETEGRRQAEAALFQAQKMEAVGQLTGGVAHDFNNLLTAVLGNLRLAERTLAGREPDGRPLAQLRAAIKAGERGARLTAQLLAFARRQQLVPAPVDLNAVLEGMADLLPAALGIGIAIDLRPCPGLWPALADVNQVETALLNLAINARDAMPEGGTLTIATGAAVAPSPELPDLPPGDYAVLSVADTGTGMPPEVRARAFEPFFTTKAQGKGSGLGLSMVYGIVRQLGGTARIDSAPGRGTAVRLYLPRAVAEAAPEAPAAEPPPLRPGAAEVLVVDDDAAVREVTAAWLAEFGYRPVQADSAAAALALLGDGARPELVLVDYAMPGMDGLQLARALRLSRPGLPVVFVTGYADTAAEEELARHHILRKPYRPAELAAAIGEALGELREAG